MKIDTSEEYYDILNTIDRLRGECIKQYGNVNKASKYFGSRHLNKYLNSNAYSLGFNLLTKICKFLDISYQFALFGGVEEHYLEQIPTFNNFYKTYKDIYKGEVDHSIYRCYWAKKVPLKYLIKVAKRSRKTVDFLIGG